MRQDFVQRHMAQRAGAGADASRVALAVEHAVASLLAELDRLMGSQAVHALYERSLRQTRAAFPWMPAAGAPARDALLADLQAALAAGDAAAAGAAGELLLAHFLQLLASLIGEPLTQRLLDAAWGYPVPAHTLQEPAP